MTANTITGRYSSDVSEMPKTKLYNNAMTCQVTNANLHTQKEQIPIKNILIVLGGGRPNGNTAQLAKAFMQGAAEAGHDVELVSLNRLKINGCLGCNACRYAKPRVQRDDFNSLVPKIKRADLIVFASPLYFWTLSSKIKAFIERFYCIAERDDNPPLGRYEKYPVHDCALLMTSADNFFWTF